MASEDNNATPRKGPPQPGPLSIASVSISNSDWLFDIAKSTAGRCKELANKTPTEGGSEGRTEEAIGCILLAAAAAEAFINELGYSLKLETDKKGRIPSIPSNVVFASWSLTQLEAKRDRTLLKFEFAILALTGKPPDRGAAPLQDLALLFDLRNDLMHIKRPSTIHLSEDEKLTPVHKRKSSPLPKSVTQLIGRGLTRRLRKDYRTFWIGHLMTDRVALWAYEVGVAACRFVAMSVPKDFVPSSLPRRFQSEEE